LILLPAFEEMAVADISAADITTWEKRSGRPATPSRASGPGEYLAHYTVGTLVAELLSDRAVP
jgi:hypothetical protein